jgi:hypothetical protein
MIETLKLRATVECRPSVSVIGSVHAGAFGRRAGRGHGMSTTCKPSFRIVKSAKKCIDLDLPGLPIAPRVELKSYRSVWTFVSKLRELFVAKEDFGN